jgi:ABC-2 type transport system permease protein
MNELQMKFISNKAKSSEGKVHVVKKEYWLSAPQFSYQFIPVSQTISNQFMALITLIFWFFIVLLITVKFSNRFKII